MRFRFIRVVLVVALIGATAGCGYAERREAESVASQEAQMKELGAQLKQWGEDILEQIPEDEIEETLVVGLDSHKLSDDFDPWPQYQIWDAIVQLKPEDARSPVELSDDLEPWLLSEGWQRSDSGKDEVMKYFVRKAFSRDGYTLSISATREPPPYAQNLTFGMSSPPTKP